MYSSYTKNVYCPPLGQAHYRHFHVPDNWKPHIKQIIGKDGCNFIRATKRSNCAYIWHHRDTDIIEVWGPHKNLMYGEKCVKDMAKKYLDTEVRPVNADSD